MDEQTARKLIAQTPEFVVGSCPWCGATTMNEAEALCRPQQRTQTGNWDCGVSVDAPETGGLIYVRNPEFDRLAGYLWGWHALHDGLTTVPPEWGEA